MVFIKVKVKLTHVYTARTYMNEVDMSASTQKQLFPPRHRYVHAFILKKGKVVRKE